MPGAASILTAMTGIANDLRAVAVAWHAVAGAVLIAILAGWRPSNRLLAGLLVLPIVSVSAIAWLFGNPFNGTMFAVLAVLLAAVTRRFPGVRVRLASSPSAMAGTALAGLGLVYPHFLQADSWVAHSYASPFALIPCPTLMVLIGTTLACNVGSTGWRTVLAAAGVFYGAFGVFTLGVWLDWPLLAGAVLLGAHTTAHAWAAGKAVTRAPVRNHEVHI